MNLSKYIGKTFPAGKTAKEIGIDTSRKFVVVEDWACSKIKKGDTLTLQRTDGNSKGAYFTRLRTSKTHFFPFNRLAYLEEEDEKIQFTVDPEKDVDTTDFLSGMDYVIRKGDKVRLEAVVTSTFYYHPLFNGDAIDIQLDKETSYSISKSAFTKHATLISRAPRFIRTLTKAEAEKLLSEKLGEEIEIE